MTYKIIRFRFEGEQHIIARGLNLQEAQAHCKREDTHHHDRNGNVKWFDGYTEE